MVKLPLWAESGLLAIFITLLEHSHKPFICVLPMVAFMLQQGSVVVTDLLAPKYLLPGRLQKKTTSSC